MPESKDITHIKSKMLDYLNMIEKRVNSFAEKVEEKNNEVAKNLFPVIDDFAIKFTEFFENLRAWDEESKINVQRMVDAGWFPNPLTYTVSGISDVNIDEMMVLHLDRDLEILERDMIKLCPCREHILRQIFELHRQKRFIASIPLIFAQADGICDEEFGNFFGGGAVDRILNDNKKGAVATDLMTELMLIPLMKNKKLNIKVSTEKASKERGANRHAVLHGHKDYLDYGTELNGYKSLSFLVFIISFVKLVYSSSEGSKN